MGVFMIDIHNHTLYGIDDGSQTIEEAIELLQQAKQQGIEQIILTPHYVLDGSYYAPKDKVIELINSLDEYAKELDITLHTGHELFIHRDLCECLKNNKCCTLANSKYILVEFPFDHYDDEYDYILEDLRSLGYKIIIAHPERYSYVKKDVNFCLRWLEEGDLLQCNQNSFLRKDYHKLIKKMLTHGFISFIASDTHGKQRPIQLKEVYELVTKKYGQELANDLFYNNAKAIIEHKVLVNNSYRPVKGLFR